jgi:hypothetical protein
MAKSTKAPKFDMDVVDKKEAATILKKSRQRGSRSSKYTPVYESIADLKDGDFLVLRSLEKSSKLGIYQGVKRNFGDDVKMASARDNDADGEHYTVVIGKATDHDEMRELAKRG